MKTTINQTIFSADVADNSMVKGNAVDASDLRRASFMAIFEGTGTSYLSPLPCRVEASNDADAPSHWGEIVTLDITTDTYPFLSPACELSYRWLRVAVGWGPGISGTVTMKMQAQLT